MSKNSTLVLVLIVSYSTINKVFIFIFIFICDGELFWRTVYDPVCVNALILALTIVVNRSIFKFIYQIQIEIFFANIDLGIAPKL